MVPNSIAVNTSSFITNKSITNIVFISRISNTRYYGGIISFLNVLSYLVIDGYVMMLFICGMGTVYLCPDQCL